MPDQASSRRWDVFCSVVDNFGDAGICWRLARQLALEHRIDVRLWIDLPQTLERLVPGLVPGGSRDGVRLCSWRNAEPATWSPDDVADVIVTAFAAELPGSLRSAMRPRRPLWINFSYLSAESWVDDTHGLPSPKHDGLVEHFFFPGFTDRSGGLLREADLLDARDRFIGEPPAVRDWLRGIGVQPQPGERLLSLFCYPQAPAERLLEALATSAARWRVLVPEGVLPTVAVPPGQPVAVQRIPFLPQRDYDRLLWACDANFVRGEDSIVRALWAARPLVWQAYPQAEDAHLVKLQAFVRRFVLDASAGAAEAEAMKRAHAAWNAPGHAAAAPALADWLTQLPAIADAQQRWVAAHAEPGQDLVSRLVRFVACRL